MIGALAIVTVTAMLLIRRVDFVSVAFTAFLIIAVLHGFRSVFAL